MQSSYTYLLVLNENIPSKYFAIFAYRNPIYFRFTGRTRPGSDLVLGKYSKGEVNGPKICSDARFLKRNREYFSSD